jgi:hypothetical protein
MGKAASNIINVSNKEASLSVDMLGGAIVDFHLATNPVNPLTFKFSAENMPDNNKSGANYQGHFVCMGRWGPPTAGEIKAGLPDHGQAANLLWTDKPSAQKNEIHIQVDTPLEGLHVERTILLDDLASVFTVSESVKNINPLSRLYNVVQHPTLARPFLTNDTIVNCNADKGFNYKFNTKPLEHAATWPFGTMEDLSRINLSKLNKAYNSVFSFSIKKDAKFGWITAYSPQNNLLIGYLWKRGDYAWINLWQDFEGGNIRYRGLEFGTTGMHKPYKEIIAEENHQVFGDDSYKYIDAGETQTRAYLAFICETPAGYTETGNINLTGGEIIIEEAGKKQQITIKTSLKL